MPFLPPFAADGAICRLPLSAPTAAALYSALLDEDGANRVALLEAALAADPALTLWTAIHPRRRDAPPHTPRALAEWLADCAPAVLQWPGDAMVASEEDDAPSRELWTRCAAASFALADAAEQRVVEGEPAGRARLLAFLAQAPEWLQLAVRPAEMDAIERFAPAWLPRPPIARNSAEEEPRAADADSLTFEVSRAPQDSHSTEALAERWSRPISQIAEALPRLAAKLRRLTALEAGFEAALRREKLASLQKLAYGASHEINNPLANIASRAQALLQEETDPERRRALATINDQAFRAFEMIANMMLFAKPPDLDLELADLSEIVARVLDEMAPIANQQGTTLRFEKGHGSFTLRADRVQLAVLLRAMLRNAFEAVASGGKVTIDLRRRDHEIELRARDTGPGLSDEARRHLFDPFYSGREAGRGLGFGLSWCWNIVESHGGRIAVESTGPAGTTLLVSLPIHGPEGESTAYQAPGTAPSA